MPTIRDWKKYYTMEETKSKIDKYIHKSAIKLWKSLAAGIKNNVYVSNLSPTEKLKYKGLFVIYEIDPITKQNNVFVASEEFKHIDEWLNEKWYGYGWDKILDKDRIKIEQV